MKRLLLLPLILAAVGLATFPEPDVTAAEAVPARESAKATNPLLEGEFVIFNRPFELPSARGSCAAWTRGGYVINYGIDYDVYVGDYIYCQGVPTDPNQLGCFPGPYCTNDIAYVYWELVGSGLGTPSSCGGTVSQCGMSSVWVDGCDPDAYLNVIYYYSNWSVYYQDYYSAAELYPTNYSDPSCS